MKLEEARKKFPPMWVIYDRPEDFPASVVVRVWYGEVSAPDVTLFTLNDPADSLKAARAHIQHCGASVPLARDSSDAPCIVETWI